MLSIKQCDAFLAKYHRYISPFILSMSAILVLNLITPTVLLAAEPGKAAPKQIDFQKIKPAPKKELVSSTVSTSTKPVVVMSQRQRQEEIKKLKNAVLALEKSLVTFRSQLERTSRVKGAALPAVNVERINNLIKIIKEFKLIDQQLVPVMPLPIITSTPPVIIPPVTSTPPVVLPTTTSATQTST